jgi:hypothetical protein
MVEGERVTLTLNAGGYPDLPLVQAWGYDPAKLFAQWVKDDPHQPEEGTARYYETKAQIAAFIKPKRVVEIGVRAGYSALAFYMGHPYEEFYGMDMDEGGWGGVKGYMEHAKLRLGDLSLSVMARLEKVNTQEIKVLPEHAQRADLFHVDGDHTPKGTAHDILLGLTSGARYVVVDDYDYTEYVREGADWAIRAFGLQAWYAGDQGYRGNVVIQRRQS